MEWKGMGEREICLIFAAWLIGRVGFLGVNPFALALFTVICYEGLEKRWYFLALGLGLVSGCGFYESVKQVLAMALVGIFVMLLGKRREKHSLLLYNFAGMGSLLISGVLLESVIHKSQFQWNMVLLQLVLVAGMIPILQKGVHFFLTGKETRYANNEEMIAGTVIISLLVYGAPFQDNHTFSVMGFLLNFFILYMGYRFGSGAGSLAGAISGLFYIVTQENIERVGILVLLGASAGIFRELGRFISGALFTGLYAVCGVYFDQQLLQVQELRAIVVALFAFFLLPRPLTKKVESFCPENTETEQKRRQFERQVGMRLEALAEPFFQLSNTFVKLANQKVQLEKKDMDKVLGQVRDGLCQQCEKYNRCLGFTRHEKYETANYILGPAREYGFVTAGDFPLMFTNKCDYLEHYVEKTNEALKYENYNVNWEQKLLEGREAVAEQLQDVGFLIRDIGREITETKELSKEDLCELKAVLKMIRILTQNIERRINNKRMQEIRVIARAKRNSCVTTKQMAKCISQVLGKSYVPSQSSRHVLAKEWDEILLLEEAKFKVLTGVARCKKAGEKICGDNYSFLNLEQEEMILALADGTGSGEDACLSSTFVIELLEKFMEAGVGIRTSLRLINSLCVMQKEDQPLSTLDMVDINLYTGVCEFIKLGGAKAFIKRGDMVECIASASLPLGIFSKVDYEDTRKKMYEGDTVILMSDGVLECFSQEEGLLEDWIQKKEIHNPQEFANELLAMAIEMANGKVTDDMTVLVGNLDLRR